MPFQPPGSAPSGTANGSAATRATFSLVKSVSGSGANQLACLGSQTTSPSYCRRMPREEFTDELGVEGKTRWQLKQHWASLGSQLGGLVQEAAEGFVGFYQAALCVTSLGTLSENAKLAGVWLAQLA